MFARSASFVLLALPILASAAALRRGGPPSSISNSCNTGSLQCCQSTQDPSSHDLSKFGGLFGLLGIDVSSVTGLVGLTCSGIDVIGVSGNSCSAQPVCCTNNTFNGVVALGCTPVNLNL